MNHPLLIFDMINHDVDDVQVCEHPAEDIQRLPLHEGASILLLVIVIILVIIIIDNKLSS